MAALLGAILLAVVSPAGGGSEAGAPAVVTGPSVAPVASPPDDRVPIGRPAILDPLDGTVVAEWEIEVVVEVPRDALPRQALVLEILVGDKPVTEIPQPRPGKVSTGVRLTGGSNAISAVLRGPGGVGPESEPVSVSLDLEPPDLVLTAPRDGLQTTERAVSLVGSTEPGVRLEVRNAKTKRKYDETIGPGGAFDIVIPLDKGNNRIRLKAIDDAGGEARQAIVVKRLDAKPDIELKAPRRIRKQALPKDVPLRVIVRDAAGKPVEGARVTFTLSVYPQPTVSHDATTDASGRARWPARVSTTPADSVTVSVDVTTPAGANGTATVDIKVS